MSEETFTTTISEMATVQNILDSGATTEEYLDAFREIVAEFDLAATDDTELDEKIADRILDRFRVDYMGDGQE